MFIHSFSSSLSSNLTCPSFREHHDAGQFFFSFLLWLGILFSYVPQQMKIIELGSSEGLALSYLMLSVLASLTTFLNVMVLQAFLIPCCTSVSANWVLSTF
ncbi:hypothetical protein HMI56_006925 [Coelomomyces lativittatus]|nr:hypothetical protein HMI56_006925 [Coelomomyces lativittatus]